MASLLSRIGSVFRRTPKKQAPTPPATLSFHVPRLSTGQRRGTNAVLQAYRDNAWLQTVIDIPAKGIATCLRLDVYKSVKGKAGSKRAAQLPRDITLRRKALEDGVATSELVALENHEILQLLAKPNDDYPPFEFWRLFVVHYLLCGEVFIHLIRSDDGSVVSMYLLPPSSVMQTPTAQGSFYMVTMNLQSRQLHEDDVIHIKRLDPLEPTGRGTGIGIALGDEIDTIEAISRTVKATFRRGGMPAGVVSVERAAGEEEEAQDAVEDLQKRFEAGHTGPENAGKLAFVPGHVHVAKLNSSLADDQTVSVLERIEARVRQCIGVPKELVGADNGGDRNKAEAAAYTLADQVLLPLCEFIRDSLQLKLVPKIDPAVILECEDPRPSQKDRVIAAMTATLNPAFEYNELRESVGYEPKQDLEGVRPPLMPGQSVVTPTAERAQTAEPAAKEDAPVDENAAPST
jgi:HK97 family phage portal protein